MMVHMTLKIIVLLQLCQRIKLAHATSKDYSNSNLDRVPGTTTSGVTHLNLKGNNIRQLHSTSLQGYDDLIELILSYNGLQIINDGVFSNIHQLKTIRLEKNKLTKLPADFGPSTTVVTTFQLFHSIIDPNILSYPYLSAFTNLAFINIGGSRIIGNLDVSVIPPSAINLLANRGSMDTFPNLSLFPLLSRLNLDDNKLKVIPQEAVAGLFNVKQFTVAQNKIVNFPNFSHCKSLWQIHMDQNNLTTIPRQHVEGLKNIQQMFLDNNRLTNMTDISYLHTMENFKIGQNQIMKIPEEFIMGLPNMRLFGCENNNLLFLPNISRYFPQLQELYVQGNKLKTLPDLYDMPALSMLTVANNPYVCNRSLCWLRMLPWMKPNDPMIHDTPRCDQPTSVTGTEVSRFHPTAAKCYEGKQAVDICSCRYRGPLHIMENWCGVIEHHTWDHFKGKYNQIFTRLYCVLSYCGYFRSPFWWGSCDLFTKIFMAVSLAPWESKFWIAPVALKLPWWIKYSHHKHPSADLGAVSI